MVFVSISCRVSAPGDLIRLSQCVICFVELLESPLPSEVSYFGNSVFYLCCE